MKFLFWTAIEQNNDIQCLKMMVWAVMSYWNLYFGWKLSKRNLFGHQSCNLTKQNKPITEFFWIKITGRQKGLFRARIMLWFHFCMLCYLYNYIKPWKGSLLLTNQQHMLEILRWCHIMALLSEFLHVFLYSLTFLRFQPFFRNLATISPSMTFSLLTFSFLTICLDFKANWLENLML